MRGGVVKYWYVVLALVVLAGCSGGPAVICSAPYILVGQECCLDSNDNDICDADDDLLAMADGTYECPDVDCSLCPATIVEKNVSVQVVKYICEETGLTVEDPKECTGEIAANPFEDYEPYDGAEDRSVLEEFSFRAACRDSINSVEIHYIAGSIPSGVEIQVKESPTDGWETVYTLDDARMEKYLYAAFCEDDCTMNVEFFLDPNKVYLMRAEFDYLSLYGEVQRSNEYVIDAREDGEYLRKLC